MSNVIHTISIAVQKSTNQSNRQKYSAPHFENAVHCAGNDMENQKAELSKINQ